LNVFWIRLFVFAVEFSHEKFAHVEADFTLILERMLECNGLQAINVLLLALHVELSIKDGATLENFLLGF
jgi:hypothetical protein